MKELLQLYILYFKLGIVNFGGGYAMLPLLDRELCTKRGWVSYSEIADYYAVGQCTPGAIAVNVSTFVGIKRKGVIGGIVATLGFVSPAFLIIFLIASLLTSFASNVYVENALAGIRVCVFSLVLFAIVKLWKKSVTDIWQFLMAISIGALAIFVNVIPLYVYVIIAAALGLLIGYLRERKVKFSPKEEAIKENNEEPQAEAVENIEATTENTDETPKEEIKEEAKLDVKKEKKSHNIDFKAYAKITALALSGFLLGCIIGPFGFILTAFFKNKNFRAGFYASLVPWFIILSGVLVLIFGHSSIIFILYFQFFKVGICAFGGGLATIPFLTELSAETGWFSTLDLANMLAVSESTPGAMGVNMSTYVGYMVLNGEFNNLGLSFLGSMISTLGLVTPSIIVISVVAVVLARFKNNKYVEWAFYGLRAASIGLIIAALYSIVKVSLFNQYVTNVNGVLESVDSVSYAFTTAFNGVTFETFFPKLGQAFNLLFDWKAVAFAALFGIGIFKFKKHPVLYIGIAIIVGICFQMYNVTTI